MQLSALSTLSVRVTSGLGYSRKPHGVKSYSAPVILILGYHPFSGKAAHEHRYQLIVYCQIIVYLSVSNYPVS